MGDKTSSGYCPPELGRVRFAGEGALPAAAASFDVWSFGVVLWEQLAGRTLFAQDFANDELVTLADRTRLCVWRTMSDAELAPVLSNAEAGATRRQRADAKHLLRWCLKGDAAARPTVAQARALAAARAAVHDRWPSGPGVWGGGARLRSERG